MTRQGGPCPACGRLVEVDQIEVTTWADGPNNPQYIDGRTSCPSGCDPRFRRFVIARDRRGFELVCRDHGWNPWVVVYVSATDSAQGIQALRGMAVRPDMVTIVSESHPEIVSALRMGFLRGDGEARSLPFPPVPVRESSCDADDRRLPWSGVMVEADESVPDFSAARMTAAIDEAIRHNTYILERHRTEEDPFYWGDSMQWTSGRQETSQ